MKDLKLFFVIIMCIGMFSCTKNDEVNSTSPEETPKSGTVKDIYVAGYDNFNGNSNAKIWKNSVPTYLTDGKHESSASSIFVSGNDVYVVGYESNGVTNVAKIWKNGIGTDLTDGEHESSASSVFVSGNNVYVVGYESNGVTNVAKIWKNGVETDLTDGTVNAYAKSVYVNGLDVYVVGKEEENYQYAGRLWKNGILTKLTEGINYTEIESVFVKNNDVYIAGYENNLLLEGADYSNFTAKFWKNSIVTSLTDVKVSAVAQSIYIEDDNVYVAGSQVNGNVVVPKIWKNGKELVVGNFESYGHLNSIVVVKNDIYTVGFEKDNNTGKYPAKIWKNGVGTYLDQNITSTALSIFITKN
jgi:hypothetical protein